jgi:hypothetical protein
MRATLLVRYREEIIATVTTNIRQYYTTDPQTDGILVLVLWICGVVLPYVFCDDYYSFLSRSHE